MKYFIFISTIIILLLKTGNVLSNISIFNVDNIKVNNNSYKSKEELLNAAFKKGFKQLTDRILLKEDYLKLSNIQINEIKKLISFYQTIDKSESKDVVVNINFDRNKINNFLYLKNISYADISESKLVIFPVLIDKDDFYLYNENYFYNNWNVKKDKKYEFIEYLLPIESLAKLKIIKDNIGSLEQLEVSKILSDYDVENYILLAVYDQSEKMTVLLKGIISKKKIVKSFVIEKNNLSQDEIFQQTIFSAKEEIIEIVKSQNLIDIRTPSFLNITLDINKKDDLLNMQNSLKKIDLIENFSIVELTKSYAKIKIKYYGKIDKISEKFKDNGIDVFIKNDLWKLKLI